MAEQPSPEKKVSAFRSWLIRTGLIPAPKEEPQHTKEVSEERKEAERTIRSHMSGRPPSGGPF
jgi:ferritin